MSHLPFSPVVKVGDMLYVSGQASVDKTGKIVSDTFAGEVRRSFENLKKILEDVGSSLDDVIQTRNYVKSDEHVAEFNEIYKEFFKAPYPSRTTLTRCLGVVQFEVDCIAVMNQG